MNGEPLLFVSILSPVSNQLVWQSLISPLTETCRLHLAFVPLLPSEIPCWRPSTLISLILPSLSVSVCYHFSFYFFRWTPIRSALRETRESTARAWSTGESTLIWGRFIFNVWIWRRATGRRKRWDQGVAWRQAAFDCNLTKIVIWLSVP